MAASTASDGSTTAPGSLREVMRQHPLLSFFFMAYAFSWIMLIPFVLSEWGILPPARYFTLAFVLNPFVGPFLSAFIMTGLLEGREGVLRLRAGIRKLRVGWRWYLLILVGIPALFLLGILVLPGARASFKGFPPRFIATYLVTFILIFFGGGPLGEEPGWRGFALPRMQKRFGPLWGTLLLGILWVFWHLPHFLTSAQRGGPGTSLAGFLRNFPIFSLMVLAMAVIFTWVFNRTRGSLFIAVLLHASINTFSLVQPLFSAPIVKDSDLGILIGVAVPALLILVFTRGRLGCQPGREGPVGMEGGLPRPSP